MRVSQNKAPQFDRLHQLWEMLNDIAHSPRHRKAFDMYTFLDVDYKKYLKFPKAKSMRQLINVQEPECGTVGCVAGWASITIPDWIKAFRVSRTGTISGQFSVFDTTLVGRSLPIQLEAFLGISATQVGRIFFGGRKTPAKQRDVVAQVIKECAEAEERQRIQGIVNESLEAL